MENTENFGWLSVVNVVAGELSCGISGGGLGRLEEMWIPPLV